jgi:(E)-4-hydroxy-3-methylbut-2-enyl-diphosphate synthase
LSQRPRRPARVVRVGELPIGGDNPIVIQSMTVADTLDTARVVAEIEGLARAGCPLVRVTVPHVKAAENLPAIKDGMRRRGLSVPLVADIHFTPAAALVAADHVEKVRINPGNFVDRRRFEVREYSDAEYAAGVERIRDVLTPLVLRLKKSGAALRIGTNHGSLSDRILNRYGDTPDGMVESALEFVRICESLDYREIILSMKSSIPSVMVAANRLLVRKMIDEGMDYPIHLGVTEAGRGLEGRVKSAIGIGSLLLDGIGDTIRVSLTEESVHEIDACRRILEAVDREGAGFPRTWRPPQDVPQSRRATRGVDFGTLAVGGTTPCRVEARITRAPWESGEAEESLVEARSRMRSTDPAAPRAVAEIVCLDVSPTDRPSARLDPFSRFAEGLRAEFPDLPLLLEFDLRSPGEIHALEPFLPWAAGIGARVPSPEGRAGDRLALLARLLGRNEKPLRLRMDPEGEEIALPSWPAVAAERAVEMARICLGQGCRNLSFLIAGRGISRAAREVTEALDGDETSRGTPVFLEIPADPIAAAVVGGCLLLDGIGDGLRVRDGQEAPPHATGGRAGNDPVGLAYTILQGCRLRLTRAEFIACPSCGRTQFDLQTTTKRIQEKTAHLSGVKIAIMGCIVNGPGEMADADFGYVGSAPGKVDLYVGRSRVRQAIPENEADRRLIDLIREHGMWTDPPGEGA